MMSSSKQSVRKHDEGGQHAPVRAPFTPQRHRDSGPDYGESPVPARDKSLGLGSPTGARAHRPAVVASNHEESRGIRRLPADDSLDRHRVRPDQGSVEEYASGIPRHPPRVGLDVVSTADTWSGSV